MRSVSIIYHYFAHYRKPVLEALAKRAGEVVLFADRTANQPNLKVMDPRRDRFDAPNIKWKELTNRWLRGFLWQKGLLGEIWRSKSSSLIFLGQVNFLSTWIALVIARLRGIPTFIWTHGIYGNEGFVKLQVRLLLYRLADGLLLYGHYAEKLLIARGFKQENLHVIYNSLDYAEHVRLRESVTEEEVAQLKREIFAEHPDAPVAVFIGRLVSSKKLDLLIRAVHACAQQGRRVNALIIGDGPGREGWARLAQELGVAGQVHFYGECHEESALARLLSLGDLCVSPGSVGLTAMHVMAYGIPVITHDVFQDQKPEFEAIVEGETGGFFKRDDLESMMDKMLHWIDQSPGERAATRHRCIEVISGSYSPEVQVDQISRALNPNQYPFQASR